MLRNVQSSLERVMMMKRTLERIRGEFLEMPGLRVTRAQVQRLCGIDESTCRTVLDSLVELKFLRLNPDGTYARVAEGHHPHSALGTLKSGLPHLERAS
jgi:DNA-binding IclR family transcriptional regulator